jgi:hypothetical protein
MSTDTALGADQQTIHLFVHLIDNFAGEKESPFISVPRRFSHVKTKGKVTFCH